MGAQLRSDESIEDFFPLHFHFLECLCLSDRRTANAALSVEWTKLAHLGSDHSLDVVRDYSSDVQLQMNSITAPEYVGSYSNVRQVRYLQENPQYPPKRHEGRQRNHSLSTRCNIIGALILT